jgi:hypothetical protein
MRVAAVSYSRRLGNRVREPRSEEPLGLSWLLDLLLGYAQALAGRAILGGIRRGVLLFPLFTAINTNVPERWHLSLLFLERKNFLRTALGSVAGLAAIFADALLGWLKRLASV